MSYCFDLGSGCMRMVPDRVDLLSKLKRDERLAGSTYAPSTPRNAHPNWTNYDIERELKIIIDTEVSHGHGIDRSEVWFSQELPQSRDPRPKWQREMDVQSRHLKRRASIIASSDSHHIPADPTYFPERYSAPGSSPRSLFKHQDGKPFTAHRDSHEVLVYTDGACPFNGQQGIRGSCAFVYLGSDDNPRPRNPPLGAYVIHGAYFFRLEDVGPDSFKYEPTSNRAELRAVVAALSHARTKMFSDDSGNHVEFSKLVIATDSTYVVDGATTWCKTWDFNGWLRSSGKPAKNQDLWKLLLERCRTLQKEKSQEIVSQGYVDLQSKA
ncbi:uncharacterized protein RAG0_13746 [Rhynchosporium agropyri]|uniref:ribonuclease H n=1 Tax=Rhynchosporium agropyri TaxID=914238 RepID=A0A1E1LDZ0_9HELO|nr:uncharacterized protein RAG0_13746 [Rhynchosporium agropyri]